MWRILCMYAFPEHTYYIINNDMMIWSNERLIKVIKIMKNVQIAKTKIIQANVMLRYKREVSNIVCKYI